MSEQQVDWLGQDAEYGILMLKPDATALDLGSEILEGLAGLGLRVTERRRTRLSDAHARTVALHTVPDYLSYLQSGEVEFLLVEGRRPAERLYEFKRRLRAARGTGDKVRNLVHAADDGVEYFRLFPVAFPDLSRSAHANRVDQGLPNNQAVLHDIDNLGRVRAGVVQIGQDVEANSVIDLTNQKFRYLRIAVALRFNANIGGECVKFDHWRTVGSLGDRFPEELTELREGAWPDLQKVGGAIALSGLIVTEEEILRYGELLRRHTYAELDDQIKTFPSYQICLGAARRGASVLFCHTPEWGLLEAEYRMNVARLCGMKRGGGSLGTRSAGEFSLTLSAYLPGFYPTESAE